MNAEHLICNAPGGARWAKLVEDIEQACQKGRNHLYEIFSPGLRVMLGRQVVEPFLSGVVNDVLADVVRAIQHGELERPDALPSLIRSSARRRVPVDAPRLPFTPIAIDPQEDLSTLKARLRTGFKRISDARSRLGKRPVLAWAVYFEKD